MKATKIAVLSDTYGLLRPEVLDGTVGCDVIIHGGDINKPGIIDRLNDDGDEEESNFITSRKEIIRDNVC